MQIRLAGATAAVAILTLSSVGRARAAPPVHSPRIANYTIAATYDERAHTVTGHETLVWHNRTREAASDVYFHLYLNAFANSESSFMHEMGEPWMDWLRLHPH